MSKCVLFADTLTAAHQINTLQGEFTLNLIFFISSFLASHFDSQTYKNFKYVRK